MVYSTAGSSDASLLNCCITSPRPLNEAIPPCKDSQPALCNTPISLSPIKSTPTHLSCWMKRAHAAASFSMGTQESPLFNKQFSQTKLS